MQPFFDWLNSVGQLDRYEAMLEWSLDYAGDQKMRLKACEDIDKLKKEFEETTGLKIKK